MSEPSTSPSKRLRTDQVPSQSQSVPLPGPGPSKKVKANSSVVHDEFTVYKYQAGEEEREGSKCKHCDFPMKHKNATNLKAHLQRKHPEVFDKVKGES